MSLYSAVEKPSSCTQYQGILSEFRQYDLDGNPQYLFEPVKDHPSDKDVIRCIDDRDQRVLELTPKQLSLFPSYVRKCLRGKHTFVKIHKAKRTFVRGYCNSWRCPFCMKNVAAKDYLRVKKALESRKPENLVYMVVTLDQIHLLKNRRGFSKKTSYAYMTERLKQLMKSLRRRFGKLQYVATMEQHQRGFAHMNLIVDSEALANIARSKGVGQHINHEDLKDFFRRAGLGRFSIEAIRTIGGLSRYLVKIAHYHRISKEVTKASQLPVEAPKGTRRLRSSIGFLPQLEKRPKDPEVEWKFLSGQDHKELNAAQQAIEKHLDVYDLNPEFIPKEQGQEPVVDRIAAADRQSEGSTMKTGGVSDRHPLLSFVTEQVNQHREANGGLEPVNDDQEAVKALDYWKRYRRLQRRSLRISRSCDTLN